MLSSVFLLCLASLSSAQLSLDIYYESLCPDSTRFISQQLGPMYEALGSDVNVNFNPYGFAETTEVDGGYEFECQHGADECYGNIVQACTLAHTEDRDTQVGLIVCMMSSPNPSTAGPDCFQQMSLDYQPILDCIESGEGDELHAKYGEIQNSLDPRPNNVPWSNFNGEHGLEYWELEEYGLTQYLCDVFALPSCPETADSA